MSKDFQLTIVDPERRERYLRLIGRNQVAVTSPIPFKAELPGHPEAEIYLLDKHEITDLELEAILLDIAQRFGIPFEEVMGDAEIYGIPVLAEGTSMTVLHPQRWF